MLNIYKRRTQLRFPAREIPLSPVSDIDAASIKALRVLNEFRVWLDDLRPKVTPKSTLGHFIGYAVDQWDAIARYVYDGRLSIDNNLADRDIKAVVIGRKNLLFVDSVDGPRANAILYCLVLAATAIGLDLFRYLKYVIEKMPTLQTSAEVET